MVDLTMLETLSSGSKTRKILFKHRNNTALVGEFDHLYLIGGGTGITPLYQIIQFISDVEVPLGKGPKITLLFANKTESDILLKGELENYELSNPNFKCFFSVDKAEKDNWTGLTGFIDEQKIR
jgi:NAD(P)H-flavin reductase